MRNACDLGVLLGEALSRVNHNHTDVGTLHRHTGADDRVFFNLVFHLAFAAQSCGINKHKIAERIFDQSIRRVTRCACNVGYNRAGFADDRHTDGFGVVLLFLLFGKQFENGVQKVACAVTVHGRNGNRVAESEIIKLIKFCGRFTDGITLVDTQHNRLTAFLQHGCHFVVSGDYACA